MALLLTKPSERGLSKVMWTRERAAGLPWVTRRGGDFLVDDRRIVFPGEEQTILKNQYEQLPPSIGYNRFYSWVNRRYLGIRRADLAAFLNAQEAKQKYRRLFRPSRASVVTSKAPGVRWVMDLKFLPEVRLRNKLYVGVAVIIDSFSKVLFAFPVSSTSVAETTRVLGLWIGELGPLAERIKVVHTDNGPEFRGGFSTFLQERGIKHVKGAPYTPASQGAAERANQVLGSYLTSAAQEQYGTPRAWIKALPSLVGLDGLINNSYTRMLGSLTPRQVLEGEGQEQTKQRIFAEANKRRNTVMYEKQRLEVGDKVRLSLRITGDRVTKATIKQNTRKGYLAQWDVSNMYTVKGKRGHKYLLEELAGMFDRTDLLKVPALSVPYEARRPVDEEIARPLASRRARRELRESTVADPVVAEPRVRRPRTRLDL